MNVRETAGLRNVDVITKSYYFPINCVFSQNNIHIIIIIIMISIITDSAFYFELFTDVNWPLFLSLSFSSANVFLNII